jgi:hypothetical protein
MFLGILGSWLGCSKSDPAELHGGFSEDAGDTQRSLGASANGSRADDLMGESESTASAFPFDFCARAGSHPGAVYETMVLIAGDYDRRRLADCLTAGLTAALTDAELVRWQDYLTQYTAAMAGCPLSRALEGGVRVFGPANTAAAGILRPTLGRDDVAKLVEHYVGAFDIGLSLADTEASEVSAFLWGTAEREIDSTVSHAIARCPGDAGAAGSALDSGTGDSGS